MEERYIASDDRFGHPASPSAQDWRVQLRYLACRVGGWRGAMISSDLLARLQVVSQDGPFASSPLRTVHATFTAHGSPASPTCEALRLFAFRIPLCLWLGQPAALRLVPGIAPGIWLLWQLRYHGTLVL